MFFMRTSFLVACSSAADCLRAPHLRIQAGMLAQFIRSIGKLIFVPCIYFLNKQL